METKSGNPQLTNTQGRTAALTCMSLRSVESSRPDLKIRCHAERGSQRAAVYTYCARTEAREPYTEDVYIFPF